MCGCVDILYFLLLLPQSILYIFIVVDMDYPSSSHHLFSYNCFISSLSSITESYLSLFNHALISLSFYRNCDICRIRDLSLLMESYISPLKICYKRHESHIIHEIVLNIPVMIDSDLCRDLRGSLTDRHNTILNGGHFIINGRDRAIINRERVCFNKVIVFDKTPTSCSGYSIFYGVVYSKGHGILCPCQYVELELKICHVTDFTSVYISWRHENNEYRSNICDILQLNYEYLSFDDTSPIYARYAEHLCSLNFSCSQSIETLLPHCPDSSSKCLFLHMMLKLTLLTSCGLRPVDCKDSIINTRIDTPGNQLCGLYLQYLKDVLNGCKDATDKFNSEFMKRSILMTHQNACDTNSYFHRIYSSVKCSSLNSKNIIGPRHVQSNSEMLICPVETPSNGEDVGLIRNIASGAIISPPCYNVYYELISILQDLSDKSTNPKFFVDLNGLIYHIDRISDIIIDRPDFKFVNTSYSYNIFSIRIDPGRLMYDSKGCLCDAEMLHVDKKKQYQIHDILGILASMTPYVCHNQGPRTTFHTSMLKQAASGVGFLPDFMERTPLLDRRHVLYTVQRPLCLPESRASLSMHCTGVNVILAICNWKGANQEDAIIMNQQSIDLGLFNGMIEDTYMCRMNENMGKYSSWFDNLPCPGDRVKNNQPFWMSENKNVYPKQRFSDKTAFVDSITLATNDRKGIYVHMKTIEPFKPMLGDKFTSAHGQKGVIGLIESPENIPYCQSNGIVPDIIINPASFPTRMTIGQLLEGIFGKHMTYGDKNTNIDDLLSSQIADEVMINPCDGSIWAESVFVCPVMYRSLNHMSQNKISIRNEKGTIDPITRQPIGGRSVGGGQRFGEMERDCLLAHGASNVLYDRIMCQSDSWNNGDDDMNLPFSMNIFMQELHSCGIKLNIEDS